MRTVIDVPKYVLDRLAELGARRGLSRAEVIRRALDSYLAQHAPTSDECAFGLWKDRVDALAYTDRLRGEWER